MKKMIYAVKCGRKTGIFHEWIKCFEQTNKYPNSKFRRFEYRSELEHEAEDVPGSLRHALKEAQEYLGDLVYLGESADCLEDACWEEEGYLPFGDESEAGNPELFSGKGRAEEEDSKDIDEEYGKWLSDNRNTLGVPDGYWKTAQDMAQYIGILKDQEAGDSVKATAAEKLRKKLVKCLADVNLNRLTCIYRHEKSDNSLGYDTFSVSEFVREMLYAYPKPRLSNMQKAEEEASIRQIFMQAEAIETELKQQIRGQDTAVEKLSEAYFNTELNALLALKKRGPRGAYLLAGPPGVGKTFMAQLFANRLGLPFKRFDMSGYSGKESIEEFVGFAPTWKNSEPGILTEFVAKKPRCVLLFDEIEKAHITVIRMFLQILDDGICEDKHNQRDVSFENAIIFFTTNAGRQLYLDARNENLTMLSERVLIDALEKDRDSETQRPYFPPEILSRMSSHTVIMLNHLKADTTFKLVEKDIENCFKKLKNKYGYELSQGKEYLARTILYSMGGSADARNASKTAGKLIDRELRKFLGLLEDKQRLEENDEGRRIEWKCNFEDATEEIKDLYFGERDCVIPVFGTVKYEPVGRIKSNHVRVKNTIDIKEFMKMIYRENVLFAVIDYLYGLEPVKNVLNVADARTIGRDAFLKLREEDKEVPVYILDGSHGYDFTEKEKNTLMKKGAGGFIESKYFRSQLDQAYMDVCCQMAMETLTIRHQVLTYHTKKELDEKTNVGSIIFCDFKLETAVESEDKSSMLSDDLRPDKSWDDIYVSEDLKQELEFFIHYLQNPKKYNKKGVKPRGVLLYGPAGTGKTSLAKIVASESAVNFLSVSASELYNGGPQKVEDEFRVARKYAPAILFIDEIDAIGMSREFSNQPNPVLNALLVEMDGFKKTDNKPVFVMAATNHGDKIDPALHRRFDRSFEMGGLDRTGRRWLLERHIKKQSEMFAVSEDKIQSIVVRSEGISPAKLEQVVEAALREGIRSGRIIDDDLFDEAFEKCIMGEGRVDSSPKKKECTAYHEAGHALISLYYSRPPAYMSIVARGNHGGYVLSETGESDSAKEYYLERICFLLGGRAAEMVFRYGLTHGVASDLKDATDIATNMVCRFGMYEEEIGLAVIKEEQLRSNEKANKLINQILSEQLAEAVSIIEANRDAMKRLVDAVMKNGKEFLTEKEILEAAGELNKK